MNLKFTRTLFYTPSSEDADGFKKFWFGQRKVQVAAHATAHWCSWWRRYKLRRSAVATVPSRISHIWPMSEIIFMNYCARRTYMETQIIFHIKEAENSISLCGVSTQVGRSPQKNCAFVTQYTIGRSLLSKCRTVSRYARKSNVVCTHKYSLSNVDLHVSYKCRAPLCEDLSYRSAPKLEQ